MHTHIACSPLRRIKSLVLLLALAAATLTSFAANYTWDGGGANGNWSTAANWNPDGAPTATGNVLVFDGTANLSAVNDVVTSLATSGTAITFNAGAGSFTLSGNAITVGSGGGAGQTIIQQSSTSAQTISLNLNFSGGSGDRSIVFASGAGSLTLSGNVNFSNDWLFPMTTAGTIILSGSNSGDGKAYNAGGISAGTNTMNAMMRNNVAGTQLVIGSDTALGNSGSGSAAAGTAAFRGVVANQQLNLSTTGGARSLPGSSLAINANNITFNGASNITLGNIITVNGNRDFVVSSTGAVTLSGGIFLSNDQTGRQLYVNLSGAGGMTVNGAVADTFHSGGLTTGTSTLRKASGGTLRLNGNSSYAATTQVDAGSLLVNGTHAPTANSGRYLVLNGATLGGNGTIKPFDTTGSLTGLSLAGVTAPGDPAVNGGIGTLTFDGSNSTRSVISFEGTGTWAMQLGAYGTGDKIALTGGQANDVFFNNNVVNFTDTTAGDLAGGQYVLFSADVANAFSGLTKDGSGTITAGLTIGSGLSAYLGSTLQVVGNNIVLNLNAPAPGAPSALTVTSTSGGTALAWTAGTNAGAFTVKRATSAGGPYTTIASGVTATSYVDRAFTPGTTYYYVVVSTSGTGTSADSNQVSATPTAVNSTWNGGTGNYSDTTKWSGGVIASGPGATMTITNVGTITSNIAVSLGSITGSWGSGTSLVLQGSAGGAINFATTSSTPTLNLATYFLRYDYLTNLTIAGTQGLNFVGASNVLVLQSGLNWSGFSGGLNLVGPGNGDGGTIYAQAANALPATALTLTPGSGTNGYRNAKLVLNGGANQTIGALNSTLVGTGTAYISSYTSGSQLTGGTPSGTNASGFATLTIGVDNGTGIFRGKIGTGFLNGSNTEDATANLLNIVKTGTGTQTFAGTNNYIGTTTVSGGTLLIDGTYDQGTGANAGRIFVDSGATLGGTGTIKLSDTNGGTTGLSITGTVSPGDPATNGGVGTLTIDGSTSARSVAAFEGGGKLHIRLNSGFAASKIALTGGQSNDVFFNNNVVDFSDVSGGGLSSGAHVIFSADVAGTFAGLTTDANGVITAGLAIGSGLSAYTNTSLQVVGNSIVLNLTNPNEPVPVGLSFNVKASSNTGMTPGEIAGPSGARFGNWNNFDVTNAGGSIANLVDSNGAQVTGVNVTLTGGNAGTVFSRGLASPSNDVRMFDTVLDKFDGTAATLTVTGIPFGTYDVVFYMADDGAARGGRFTVGGTTYYLRGGAGTPTSSGTGYVQSIDTNFDSGADTQANYVKFTGLSGPLTATFTAVNEGDSVQRLKFSGFQIVGSAAPPTSAPSAPTGVTITANSATSFTVAWSAVNGATSYQIFRSTTAGSFDFGNPLASVAAPGLSYTDTTAVAGTTYYYVVRAMNGVGSSASSSELSTPPPNLDSVAASSPVIWPGGSSTLSWVIPNADSLTIDDGGGAQSHATSGSLTVTPASTTTYTFAGTNAQGTTTKSVTITVVPKPNTRDSLWQWSVPLTGIVSPETNDNPRAFLYIPPGVSTVRGVVIGQHNMLEEPILEHTAVRQGLADAGMAAIWVSPSFDGAFNFTANPNTPVLFQQMMDALAAESGYAELSKTPVVWIGHSAMAEAPYFFAAWDTQHSVATGEPKRCAAAISIKGWYPGKHDATTPTYADSDLAGVPLVYVEGEYADANGRAAGALNFRNSTPGSIVSFFADVGGGHFDWNDSVCEYIGMVLRKLGQYRLPATAAADGTATLQTIDPSTQGWQADRWRKGQSPTANPAAVGAYAGNASEAFWYFDQEHAETTHNAYLPVKTTYQLVGYTQNGTLVDQVEDHLQVHPSFSPEPTGDGLTFKLGTAFLDTVPVVSSRLAGWANLPVGSAIGHSNNGPILISRICGPVEQLSPDTFRIAFDRVGTNNIYGQTRSRDIVLMAVHPGDSTYVRAVQQALVRFNLPLTSGAAQTINFTQPSDQLNGASSVNLSASTTGTATYAEATVSFYVRQGPAKVNGSTLEFTTLPPRTKFPVKVTVVATQYGRTIAPLLQTATPVTRTFWIHKDALEQWRYEHFGTLNTDANGEQSWTLAPNSGDTDDADNDGRSNLDEYNEGSDPLADDVAPTIAAPAGGFTPLVLTAGAGGTATLPDYLAQAAITDPSGIASAVQSPASGEAVSLGSTTVALTATDTAGNVASTSISVTVNAAAPTQVSVARAGQVVPGLIGTTFKTFGVPAINDAGDVAFLTTVTAGTVTWSAVFDGTAVIARKGDAAPELPGVAFANFKDPALNDDGEVAFLATLANASGTTGFVTTANNQALLANEGGSLAVVVRTDDLIPGLGGAKLLSISAFQLLDDAVLFSGLLQSKTAGIAPGPGGVTTANDFTLALWTRADGVRVLLREGDNLSGKTVKTISTLLPAADSTGHGRKADSTPAGLARVAFSDGSQAVIDVDTNGVAVLAQKGDVGPSGPAGAKWNTFGLPTVNANGDLALLGSLATGPGGVTTANNAGIFADGPGGVLASIVRKGDVFAGLTLSALKDPLLNAAGDLVTQVTLTGGGVTAANSKALLFAPAGSTPVLAARIGAEPAGVPGAQWKAFKSIALPDGLGPIFTASMATGLSGAPGPGGVTTATDVGLWAFDSAGTLHLLVREGDLVDLSGTPKTVKTFMVLGSVAGSPGQTRAFNASGQIVYRALFTDNSQAVLKVAVP